MRGSLPLVCANCGANMRIIASITDTVPVERFLLALGEPPRAPRSGEIGRSRGTDSLSAPSRPRRPL